MLSGSFPSARARLSPLGTGSGPARVMTGVTGARPAAGAGTGEGNRPMVGAGLLGPLSARPDRGRKGAKDGKAS